MEVKEYFDDFMSAKICLITFVVLVDEFLLLLSMVSVQFVFSGVSDILQRFSDNRGLYL